MHPHLALAIAIASEVVATLSLKASDGFTKGIPSALVVLGYGSAFYFLSIALKSIPLGIAYAVWSGVGIVLVSLVAWMIYGQKLDAAALIGMSLIVAGVMVVNVFSKSATH